MIRKNEYHCLPHGAAVAQMQTISILHQVRARAAPACSPEPPQKTVCHQFPRCKGCPYPAHGFLCWGGGDDCLRTRMKKLNEVTSEHNGRSGHSP